MLRAYGEGNIFGEPYGEGPLRVVWLHGWGRRGQDFAAAARELAELGIASVALDLPGFGSSPLPPVAGGARSYARWLVPTLGQMAPGPLVLVGHSFGGRVATVVAATNPELVSALVLTGVPLLRGTDARRSPRRFRALRWLHAKSLVSEERMEAARQRYGSSDYRQSQGILRAVLVATVIESYEDELSRLCVPVAMLWGERDRVASVEMAKRAAALVTSAPTLRVLPESGHLVPTEAPHDLVEIVAEMMQ